MKKQQNASSPGKKLSRNEMKNLTGGLNNNAGGGLWVCTADYYDCYFSKYQCQLSCSVPSSCRFYSYCP
jgi:hypothetical protein